jgi:galactokinase
MDQFIASFGESGHALMLDCRSLEYQLLVIPQEVRLVICNSMVRHDLAAGEYNRRRADCETGVRILRQYLPSVRALRDVSLPDLEIHRNTMSEVVYRRCRHVITENQRVLDAAEALRLGDLAQFGQLMYASHRSLRDDYEVSCEELDLLVKLAGELEGVCGARMTGGGFGGCTINLVQAHAADHFKHELAARYGKETGRVAEVYICSAADGASEWKG